MEIGWCSLSLLWYVLPPYFCRSIDLFTAINILRGASYSWSRKQIANRYDVGNGLNVAKVMPESAIRFGSYEAAKKALARFEGHEDTKNINVVSKFVAGGLAGVVAQ